MEQRFIVTIRQVHQRLIRGSLIAGTVIALTALGVYPAGAEAPAAAPSESATGPSITGRSGVQEFIVGYLQDAEGAVSDQAARDSTAASFKRAGRAVSFVRRLGTKAAVLRASSSLNSSQTDKLLADLRSRPGIAYVEPNRRLRPTMSPDDTRWSEQWDLTDVTAGMSLSGAWDVATGAGVTVAVVDTGITDHADLAANVIPGYDFISDASDARDGNGRDANARDEGDWTTVTGECSGDSDEAPDTSSWHGTHVAGTIAAAAGNAQGIAGVAFNAKVQPVRVLGRCGGTTADIADGIVWASGGFVWGAPVNPTPAKVINMSLGGYGSCSTTFQNAINSAVSRGTTVVVAAGNEAADARNSEPANCDNVIAVAASDPDGNLADYSNYGAAVDVTAPGGETHPSRSGGILSTLNAGTTRPAGGTYEFYQGTSMATPHVAGLAALILSRKQLAPATVESVIKANARRLPGICSGGCGTGLIDAAVTLRAVTEGKIFESTSNVDIPSHGPSVDSPIPVTGVGGNAPSSLRVGVDIKHSYRGDLAISLVSPDGTVYPLKQSASWDSSDDVNAIYVVDASPETANGIWRLRVRDVAYFDKGFIDAWSLTF
ncbi:S8 family serine peptidase [Streptomyces sp. NPDC056480]|uniref:S8 family serine peptidase n=1 Tax=Streptomyces sp. NPDC056480 TaxID=3345833 RepID=UPI0036ABF18F